MLTCSQSRLNLIEPDGMEEQYIRVSAEWKRAEDDDEQVAPTRRCPTPTFFSSHQSQLDHTAPNGVFIAHLQQLADNKRQRTTVVRRS